MISTVKIAGLGLAATCFGLGVSSGACAQERGATPADPSSAAPSPDRGDPDQGDIVVTAQKREERLQDVPVSVSAFNATALDRLQVRSATELVRQTPGLRVSLLGNEDQPKFAIRGVSTSDFNLNTASPTGVFYDEVYVASQFLGGSQLFDVERIEVLRGPQGTLFGKNTTGGAISIISKLPMMDDYGGNLSLQYGENDYVHADGAVNVPLVPGRLAARVAFTITDSNGWVKNVNPGGRDLSSIKTNAVRASLRYEDESGFDATLRYVRSRSNPTNIGTINYGLLPGGLSSAGVNPRIDPMTGAALGVREGAYDRSGQIHANGETVNLTLNKALGSFNLTSISSYLTGEFLNQVDVDGTAIDFTAVDFFANTKEISQDIRLSSNFGGSFDFTAGLYYFRDETDIRTNYFLFGHSFNLLQSYLQTRTSYAAYVDATFEFVPAWTIYGGIRYTSDVGRLERFTVVPTIAPQGTFRYHDTKPSGRIGIRHQFNRDVMAYALYSRGYRSSGFNGGALINPADISVAKPEFLNSYELGLKSDIFDRKVTLNLSAFHYDYKDQQFLNFVSITSQQLVNAGTSRINGVEAEAILRPDRRLTLTAGMSLLDAKYTNLVLNGVNLAGNRLIEAPRATFNGAIDYEVPIGSQAIDLHVDATHISSFFFTANNDNERARPQFDINARIAFRLKPGWSFAVWGKNLSDNSVVTGSVLADAATRFTTVPLPRRFGVELNARF